MSWLQRLFARKRMENDLDRELRFHFESQVADKVRSGISESEARRLTRLEFGGIDQIKEDCRESRGSQWLESIVQDVRYGLRQLRNSPGFTITAVITLALGIGANTAIFTLVHGVLERSLPVADPSRLYRVGDQDTCCYYDGFENDNGDFDLFPYDLYLQLQHSSPEFEQLAAFRPEDLPSVCAADRLQPSRCTRSSSPAITSPCSAWAPMRAGRSCRATTSPEPRLFSFSATKLAVGLRRRSQHRRLHGRGADPSLYRCWYCAAGFLW